MVKPLGESVVIPPAKFAVALPKYAVESPPIILVENTACCVELAFTMTRSGSKPRFEITRALPSPTYVPETAVNVPCAVGSIAPPNAA